MTRVNNQLQIPTRGKGKHRTDFVLRNIYKYYVAKHGKAVPYGVFAKVCQQINEQLMVESITTGCDIFLPAHMGTLGIRKYKCNAFFLDDGSLKTAHLPIDFKATKLLWLKDPKTREEKKVVRLVNSHTDGFRYRFYWDKRTSNIQNQTVYSFLPARSHSRKLSEVLKNEDITVDFCTST